MRHKGMPRVCSCREEDGSWAEGTIQWALRCLVYIPTGILHDKGLLTIWPGPNAAFSTSRSESSTLNRPQHCSGLP